MNINESTVDDIVRRILAVSTPEKIILFGSAFRNEMTEDSDVDLLVVQEDILNKHDEYLRIRRALRDLPYPFDIILVSAAWYDASKDVVGGIAYPATREGMVIYDAA